MAGCYADEGQARLTLGSIEIDVQTEPQVPEYPSLREFGHTAVATLLSHNRIRHSVVNECAD